MCAATKDKLLYQQVSYDNSEGIKTLHTEGAALEDDIANTLIELGANMNAYHPGRDAGTPLHHAAKRGLEKMVKLLLLNDGECNNIIAFHNDDCQTALDVARV
ncbi:putative E3 ubiquitin-protein ligase XBAT35 isoform X1 [Tanacetum coccineum]